MMGDSESLIEACDIKNTFSSDNRIKNLCKKSCRFPISCNYIFSHNLYLSVLVCLHLAKDFVFKENKTSGFLATLIFFSFEIELYQKHDFKVAKILLALVQFFD